MTTTKTMPLQQHGECLPRTFHRTYNPEHLTILTDAFMRYFAFYEYGEYSPEYQEKISDLIAINDELKEKP